MIGIYQIKQAARREHMAENGDYMLYVQKQEADILSCNLDILHPSNINFGFGMRRMALILLKIGIVNAKREHRL